LLFRSFGEDYHEKKLEEAHIFPTIKKAGGPRRPMSMFLLLNINVVGRSPITCSR